MRTLISRRPMALLLTMLAVLTAVLACNLPSSFQKGKNLSQEEALQLVLDKIVKPDQLGEDPLIVFAWPDLLNSDDELHPYAIYGEDPDSKLIKIKAESWFFWIEDEPLAFFTHPARYVLVDNKSGKISVSDQEWWPVLNGEGLWTDSGEYLNEEKWAWSNITFQKQDENSNLGSSSILAAMFPPQLDSAQAEGGKRRALVINMISEAQLGEDYGAANAKNMISILERNDFETTYLGTDYDQNPKKMGKPFLPFPQDDPYEVWLDYMAKVMNPGDTLVVYVSGHGGVQGEGYVSNENGIMLAEFLQYQLKKFKPCVDIIVIIDACKSGSFTGPLKDVADLTMTSASATRPSWHDWDFGLMTMGLWYFDDNPEDEGAEYTSSLALGWEIIMKDAGLMNKVKARAYEEGITYMDALISQAYEEGKDYDVGQRFLFSDPQTSYGSEKSHCEAGSGVSLDPTPTPTPTSTPSPTPEPTPTPGDSEQACAVFEDIEVQNLVVRHMRDCKPTLNFHYKMDTAIPGLVSATPIDIDYRVLVNGKQGNCFLEGGFEDRLYCRVDISADEAFTLGHFELFANPCQEPISVLDQTLPILEGCGESQTEPETPCPDS